MVEGRMGGREREEGRGAGGREGGTKEKVGGSQRTSQTSGGSGNGDRG